MCNLTWFEIFLGAGAGAGIRRSVEGTFTSTTERRAFRFLYSYCSIQFCGSTRRKAVEGMAASPEPLLEQRNTSHSALSATSDRTFSAFSDDGDPSPDDDECNAARTRARLRLLGLSFEEPRAGWRRYRFFYGLCVVASTVGRGVVCEAAVGGGAAEARARSALAALLALYAYAVALAAARDGVLPPPPEDERDAAVRRVPPPPPPPDRLLCAGAALFVAAHAATATRRWERRPAVAAAALAADVFAFLPRLGPLVCLVLRCSALERGAVHAIHDDATHAAAATAVDAEGRRWRTYLAVSALGYGLLGARDVANAFGAWGPRRARDPRSLADDTLHAALTAFNLLAPLVPIADLNGATRRMLARFVRHRDIHAYLLVKNAPPLMRLFGFAPSRAAVLCCAGLLVVAYAAAAACLLAFRHPLLYEPRFAH